jgi:hypothetical protein
MVEPLRHRQTKGAATDTPGLPPPRHFPTLPDTRLSHSRPSAGRSGVGHEERFPPTRLSAGCGFRKETIAGMRRNGRDTPIAVIWPTVGRWLKQPEAEVCSLGANFGHVRSRVRHCGMCAQGPRKPHELGHDLIKIVGR